MTLLERAMKLRITVCAAILVLAGCSAQDGPAAANAAGTSSGGTGGAASGGSSGLGSGGMSAAGLGGMGGAGGVGGEAASAGASGAGSTIPATFETVKLVLGGGGSIMPCAAAPCHGVEGVAPPSDPLELPPNDDLQLYTNLTSYVSKACNNMKLVEPGRPAESALVAILTGPCGMTPQMPLQ